MARGLCYDGSDHVNGDLNVLVKQRVKTNIRKATTLFIAVVAAPLFIVAPSLAATKDATNNANTLKVSPVRTDIEVPAGTSKKVDTYLTNLTDAPISVRPVTNDFIAGDERGTPALILDADKFAPTHSLKRYMSPLADVTIPAKQTATVPVTITVPQDAQPGGYFGAVRFAPVNPDGGGQVNLSASVASLILMKVPGAAVEKLTMTEFKITQDGQESTYFRTPDNIVINLRFQNNGSVQLAPFGKISVLKDNQVVYDHDFNISNPREMVLPDSARRWDVPLKNLDTFGHYTVKGTFTYGSKNETIEVTKSFWVIPFWMIIAAIAVVVLLIGVIIWIFHFIRKRRDRKNMRSFGNSRSGGSFKIK